MVATMARARLKLQLDVSFGDPVTPEPQLVNYPQQLATESFQLFGYPLATVIAEKLTTAVSLGDLNTRDRDYADLYRLVTNDLAGDELMAAVVATAQHLMHLPEGFSSANVGMSEAPVHEVCGLYAAQVCPFLSSPGARLGDDGRRGQRREARPPAAGYATTDGVEIRRSGLQNDMFVLHFSHTKPVDSFTYTNPAELQDRYPQLLETEACIELSAAERTLVASSMPPARLWEATTLERRSQAQRSWQEQASPPTSSASAE